MILDQATWLYRKQFGRIFPEGAEVPEGWAFAPEVPFPAEGEYPEVIELYHTPKDVLPPVASDSLERINTEEPVRRGPGRPPKVQEG